MQQPLTGASWLRNITFVVSTLATMCLNCFAATLVSSSGTNTGYSPVGGSRPNYLGVTWTQNTTFNNVQVSASIFSDPFYPAYLSGSAYLTTKVGPGTTSSSNELARLNFTLPSYSPPVQPFVLFSGLLLGRKQDEPPSWDLIVRMLKAARTYE